MTPQEASLLLCSVEDFAKLIHIPHVDDLTFPGVDAGEGVPWQVSAIVHLTEIREVPRSHIDALKVFMDALYTLDAYEAGRVHPTNYRWSQRIEAKETLEMHEVRIILEVKE